jgi:hypothetical protein
MFLKDIDMEMNIETIENGDELLEKLKTNREQVYGTVLKTNERVLARVTDGIYRQPGSALRELISNAYDADATRVTITTDAPRFRTIRIEDDGQGMSPDTLVHVIHNIGGSVKRTTQGEDLGVTSSDPRFSPNGRRLIGKIGIGLFSVAQLTQSFQVITKRKGDNFRTVASVVLKQYNEVEKVNKDKSFESGKVNVWIEKAAERDAHGTTIVLNNIRPQTRETLSSKQFWEALEENHREAKENGLKPKSPPKYHIGLVDPINKEKEFLKDLGEQVFQSLPWSSNDLPEEAFRKLVRCVWNELHLSNQRPKLSDLFDHYLLMIWQIALAIPTKYSEGDIFQLTNDDGALFYKLSNLPRGKAEEIILAEGETIGDKLSIDKVNNDDFTVYFDGIALSRPIIFKDLPFSKNPINKPLVFIGKCEEDFGGRSADISGGPLKFHAYLFWNSKIAPVEHRGALIRVYNSSGTLFDDSFLKYQVQEITRLSQITCEIFIEKGFDSALNIDRESFNFSHPHAVYLTRWLHSALRQLTNTQKGLASKVRNVVKKEKADGTLSYIKNVASQAWIAAGNDRYQDPPEIEIVDVEHEINLPGETEYIFERSVVAPYFSERDTNNSRIKQTILEEKMKAITTVLISYGIFDIVPMQKRDEMLKSIFDIISAEGAGNV